MFSGLQELLLLILLILGLLILPRVLSSKRSPGLDEPKSALPPFKLSGPKRVIIVISIAWPVISAAILKPWQTDPSRFLFIGVLPVALIWALMWVLGGFKSPRT